MAKIIKNVILSPETRLLNNNNTMLEPTPLNPLQFSQKTLDEHAETAFQKGYLSGKNEGFSEAEQHVQPLKNQLEELLVNLPQAIAQHRLNSQKEIADTVLMITQQFFAEKTINPKALENQINQILTQLNANDTIELYLHPKDIALLQNETIQLNVSHFKGVKIKSDEQLRLGGCRIKTNQGLFDTSTEKQIEQLKKALLTIQQGEGHAPAL